MAMYNSSFTGTAEEDSDITIINPSIIHEHNDEYVPIITRLKQANYSSENRQLRNPSINNDIVKNGNVEIKQDYILIDNSQQEYAKQIEQILKYYIQDLKQEKHSQLDCDKQLTIRLIDHIRPVYTHDPIKLIELDSIQKEIASLHDKRHVEQQEKIEQLRTEIAQLNKMMLEQKADSMTLQNPNYSTDSVYSNAARKHSINDYDQWTEIEDDAKRLHEIVQSQKNHINEIVNLISQAACEPDNQSKQENPRNTIMNTLLQKIQNLTSQRESTIPNNIPQSPSLENHSPGVSPSQSLATLTVKASERTEQKQDVQKQTIDNPEPTPEEPPAPINIPVVHIPSPTRETKRCPVCNHEFLPTTSDEAMYDHIETCLFPPSARVEPTNYECPYCNKKLPGNDESAYLQHLSDCINRGDF